MAVVGRVLFNFYQLLTWPLWALLRRMRRGPRWVELSLHGAIEELAPAAPNGLRGLLARLRPTPFSVAQLRALADRLASDTQVEGVLVSVGTLRLGWSTLLSLRDALRRIVDQGKRVVVFLPEGGSQQELFVAAAASSVAAAPSASFTLLGPMASRRYIAPLLGKLGLQVEVVAQGRYKTAAEALVRDHMSEAEREQSDALIGALKQTLSQGLAERVGTQLDAVFAQALFGTDEARGFGLVDQSAYRDEVEASLGLSKKAPARDQRAYMRTSKPRRLLPLRRKARIAVLQLQGPIGNLSSARSIALKPTSAALQTLREQGDVHGVVLFLDTPGGSASVSDLLHHEVLRLAREKPVVAWMGNVAASGGYYLAAGAQRIVAHPCSITGSIGVISAHVVAADLLAQVGVNSDVVKHTPYADLASMARPLTEAERSLLSAQSERFYRRFLQVVAEGRGLPLERIAELAQGRVWSGSDAHAVGLVDTLGGYAEALAELRTLLGAKASAVSWEAPLTLRPRGDRDGMWGGMASLGGLLLEADPLRALRPLPWMPEVVQLALRHGPLLAYAPGEFGP